MNRDLATRLVATRAGVLAGVLVLIALVLSPVGALAAPAPGTDPASDTASATAAAPAALGPAYRRTKTLERVFVLPDGTPQLQTSNRVTVTAAQTTDLRGRQRIRIGWTGASPSAGRSANPYGVRGLQQEYPVVILQCRGRDDASLPPAQRLRPETCWTSSFSQRSQVQKSLSIESTWTNDLYADQADKERISGTRPFPSAEKCPTADTVGYATHLTAFSAASGTGFAACSAETMPPEAAIDGAFPAAEVAAFTDLDGNGSVQFEVRSAVENESLGCSETVDCSIVVIPIVGLSCDQPATPSTRLDRECRLTGQFPAGESNFSNRGVDQAVSPSLWWSASNWRNRFSIPITFGLPPDVCQLLDSRPAVPFYGSELLAQAALQWTPAYCLAKDRFKFQLNLFSDIAGFNLMQSGRAPAAVVSSAHERTVADPIAYAPTAVTGFGIGYVVDRPDNAGEVTNLRLTPRLVAKLLTQSYLGSDLGRAHPGIEDNPLGIMLDPEFTALNPGLSQTPQEAGAALLNLADDSDVVQQLTSWIAADPEAMAFVRGEPDEFGMVVNPSYRGIELPRQEWPLLDEYIPQTQDRCRQENPQVYFNQLASPVTRLRQIAEAVLDGWPNIQTRCEIDAATGRARIGRIDQQSFGSRFVLGVISLGDAERYGLRVASLETDDGRFVGATDAGLSAAVSLSEQRGRLGPFVLDQRDVARDGRAYPGAMVVYTAARTRNLEQEQADDVAQFIRVSTTEGQRPGTGNGELPGGYLPIRRTGPTAPLFESARRVADAVEAQRSAPRPVDPAEPTDPTDPTEPTDPADPDPTGPDGTGGTTDTGGTGGTGGLPGMVDPDPLADDPLGAPGGTRPDVGAPSDGPGTDTVPVLDAAPAAAVATTDAAGSGLMAAVIPLLLALAVAAGGWLVATRFLVRPPRRLM